MMLSHVIDLRHRRRRGRFSTSLGGVGMSFRQRRIFGLATVYAVMGLTVAGLVAHFGNQPRAMAAPGARGGAGAVGLAGPGGSAADAKFQHDVVPLLAQYCYSCHNAKKPTADL